MIVLQTFGITGKMAYSGCSERTNHRWIREKVLYQLISFEEETASHVEFSAHHDVHVNDNSVDADFQYSVSPESTLSDPGDNAVFEGDKETVHTPVCDSADNEVLEGGLVLCDEETDCLEYLENIDIPVCDSGDENTSDSDTSDIAYNTKEHLADWATKFNISHAALGELLQILNHCNLELPKDPRSLLATPKQAEIKNVAGGHYYYFGVESSIVSKLATISSHDQ